MKDLKIIKNFIPKSLEEDILSAAENQIQWFFREGTCTTDQYAKGIFIDNKTKDNCQLVHTFFYDGEVKSQFFNSIVYPLVLFLEQETGKNFLDRLMRAKINLIPKQENFPAGYYNVPHVDFTNPSGVETFVYYVNDSDGDTVIFNEQTGIQGQDLTVAHRVTPSKGTGVLFNSKYLHASTPPRLFSNRKVINLVFGIL